MNKNCESEQTDKFTTFSLSSLSNLLDYPQSGDTISDLCLHPYPSLRLDSRGDIPGTKMLHASSQHSYDYSTYLDHDQMSRTSFCHGNSRHCLHRRNIQTLLAGNLTGHLPQRNDYILHSISRQISC